MSYRSDYEQLTAEVGEIRGVVAAVRDSTFRAEQIANRRAGQLLFRFNEIAEGTKTAAFSTSREMHERVANTVKIVESLTSDVKEVQRVQGALDLSSPGSRGRAASGTEHTRQSHCVFTPGACQ